MTTTKRIIRSRELARGISIPEAAELLGVSRPTVQRLIDAGELHSYSVRSARRVLLEDIIAIQRGGGAA